MTESNAAPEEAKGALVEMPPAQVPATGEEQGSAALMRLIERAAVSRDFDVAKLEKLLDVKERWEKDEARKAFVQALSAFKVNPPKIVKNRQVSFRNKAGTLTEYDHATLDQICDVVGKALAEHGMSFTWDVQQRENAAIEVTCVLTHALGHAERVTMRGMPDASGSKNLIQQVGSTTTYLERYTLLAATGLATAEMDDDGAGAEAGDPISAEQKETLVGLMRETETDTARFLKLLGVASLDELPAAAFGSAKVALEAKRSARKEEE